MKLLLILLLPLTMLSQDSRIGYMFINDNTIPLDKQQHFVGGAFIAIPTYTVSRYELGISRKKSILLSFGISSLIGLAKEISDSTEKNNKFDVVDLAYTSGGGLFMAITLDLL